MCCQLIKEIRLYFFPYLLIPSSVQNKAGREGRISGMGKKNNSLGFFSFM